jgi:5-formyltetrahydrofolate cyclo-ligase
MPVATKPQLRQQFRRFRRGAIAAAQPGLARVAATALPALVPVGKRLGIYWPIGAEPDLRAVAEQVDCALPAVAGDGLRYRPWRPGDQLRPDGCRIPAPAEGGNLGPDALALLLVPALAFDARGIRLGSGGGWYDRLRAESAWRAVPALAVLPAACLTGELPRDAWDVPFDGWLDEHGLHWR